MRQSDYSLGSRILHRLALSSVAVLQSSFDIESTLKKAETNYEGPHIFVAGLARAGTTALMRALYDTGQFRSLTYRDMPFLLMPNLWSQVSSRFRKHREESVRAHGDRIQVNFDSPEAFEEVFWRAFCGRDYIANDRLRPHDVDDHTIDLFRKYINQILASDPKGRVHYLSKNNNNILRLPAIKKSFPNAVVVIPFRHPIQQAISLYRQHKRFRKSDQGDRFPADYMTWLGHHEFGETHRPFDFGRVTGKSLSEWDRDNINYWLQVWYRAYQYVQWTAPKDSIFVAYESLSSHGTDRCRQILNAASLEWPIDLHAVPFELAEIRQTEGWDEELVSDSLALYQRLVDRTQTQSDIRKSRRAA